MRQRPGELEHSGWAGRPGPAPGRRPDVSFLAPKDGSWSELGPGGLAFWVTQWVSMPLRWAGRDGPSGPGHSMVLSDSIPSRSGASHGQDSAVMAEFGSRPAPDDRWGPAGPDRSQTGQRSGAIVPRVVTVAVAR